MSWCLAIGAFSVDRMSNAIALAQGNIYGGSSKKLEIIDKVGGGDSFAAELLHGHIVDDDVVEAGMIWREAALATGLAVVVDIS